MGTTLLDDCSSTAGVSRLALLADLQGAVGRSAGGARVYGQGPVPPPAAFAVAGAVVAVQLDQPDGEAPALGQRLSEPHRDASESDNYANSAEYIRIRR